MSKRYTESQQKVLDFKDNNLLVSASAGSGKTEVSMEYLYRLISSGEANVDEVVVVTFTVAAANELKDRLLSKLRAGEINARTLDNINKIATADIGTLHSFCQKTIKQYFYKLGIDPSFELIDEGNNAVLRNECLDRVIDTYDGDEDFNDLLGYFKSRKDTKNFKESVLDIYDFLWSLTDDNFLDDRAGIGYNEDLDSNVACTYLKDYYKNLFVSIRDKFLTLHGKIDGENRLKDFCSSVIETLDDFALKITFKEFLDLLGRLNSLPSMPTTKDSMDIKDQLKSLWGVLKSTREKCNKIFDSDETTLVSRLKLAHRHLNKFIEFIKDFDRVYTERKRMLSMMDFNDLERNMLRLCLDDEVLESFKKYKKIIVDEYQDINGVQEKIIGAISNDNLIMVGDVKQSIYGFRNSTPEIFISKYNKFKEEKGKDLALDLNDNFRSNPKILAFTNRIFDIVMTPVTSGISYKDTSRFRIRESAAPYKVEIDVIKKIKLDVDQPQSIYDMTSDSSEIDYARAEARIVASRILDLYGKELVDPSSGEKRKIDYSSMCILSRKRGEYYRAFVDELSRLRVPLNMKYSDKLLDNIDIQILLNFLKALHSDNDDIAYTGLLTSYFIGVTFDDLVKISEDKSKTVYERAKSYVATHNDSLSNKINKLNNVINKYRLRLTFSSLYDILTSIVNEWNIQDYLMSLTDGERRCMLMRKYIDSFLGSEYNSSLARYLYYVDSYAQDARFNMELSHSGDSVLVDTIHGSKGLGFGVVFLAGAGEDLSITLSSRREVARDKYFGLGFSAYDRDNNTKDSTIIKECIKLASTRADIAEELRLLYVALTRPKSKLIIVGKCDTEKLESIVGDYDVLSKTTTLGLITGAMGDDCIQAIKTCGKYEDDLATVEVYDPLDIVAEEKLDIHVDTSGDVIRSLEIEGYLDREYDSGACDITLKNSVSSLMHDHEIYEAYNPTPNKLVLNEYISSMQSGADIGTAYHKIMQEVDFDATPDDISELIDRLYHDTGNEYLRQVDKSKIYKAIQSVKSLGTGEVYREKKFLAYLPYNEIIESSQVCDRVLVQGVIDLLVKGKKNILIDYKTSQVKDSDELIHRYSLQLKIYKLAIERAMHIKIDEVYIYSFVLDRLLTVTI